MKELKFRAWLENVECAREIDGELVWNTESYYDYNPIIDSNGLLDVDYGCDIIGHSDEKYIIEQYTGLKDKNGKEIYEGDIVEYTTCYYGNTKRHRKVVEWSEWDSDDFGEPHNIGYSNLSECMVVIGNVHEDAELLEEE